LLANPTRDHTHRSGAASRLSSLWLLYGFDAALQRVPPNAWDADSPCDGWCARDIVAHACGVMNALEAMARTGENALRHRMQATTRSRCVIADRSPRDRIVHALRFAFEFRRRGR